MEGLMKLFQQYKTEMSDDYTMLRIQARHLSAEINNQINYYQHKIKSLEPQMHKKKSELVNVITSMTPAKYNVEKIMQTFIWSSLLLLTYSIFSLFSTYFFSIFIGQIISGFMATISAYILLPLLAYHHIIKSSTDKYAWNDMIIRHALLIFAMIEGLLTGHVLSNLTIHSLPPIAALTTCFIGIVTPILQPTIKNQRSLLVSVTIIGSFAIHLLIGMLFNLTFAYILLVIFYTTIGFITLQLLIANVDENVIFTHIYQFAILYSSLSAEFLVYELFGEKV